VLLPCRFQGSVRNCAGDVIAVVPLLGHHAACGIGHQGANQLVCNVYVTLQFYLSVIRVPLCVWVAGVCMCVCVCVCVLCVCVGVCVCVWVGVHVCVWVCVCVSVHV